jgi:hypothetical protein
MPIIISADELKKGLPNYSPDRAEEFHQESARKADKLFTKALKENHHSEVILLSGGTASGKTEFLATQLNNEDGIIMDATLSTEEFAKNKIRQIIKAGKTPIIYTVIPDDLRRAFIAFLNRDRKFSDAHFYRTHSGSRKALLWIAENYPNVEINIIESFYGEDKKMQFKKRDFITSNELVNFLNSLQMTENDIISSVSLLQK